MSEGEVWRDITGYEGLYKVSNRGNVYSVERITSQGKKIGGRTLRLIYSRDGYPQVSLYKNGVMKTKLVHRLVLEAFIPNPENHPEVNHIDEVKDNNKLSNLEWCTSKHNANHGTRNERLSKKVRAVNVKTGEVLTFDSTVEVQRQGYSGGRASEACRGVYYGGNLYRGHKWSYIEEENK